VDTFRREAVRTLLRMTRQAKELAVTIDSEMDKPLDFNQVQGYQKRAKWLADDLAHLSKQLSHLKDLT